MRGWLPLWLVVILSMFGMSERLYAQSIANESGGKLVVATKSAPPFAVKLEDGQWRGLSVDLWRSIAEDLGIAYEFQEMELDAMIAAIASGEVDAAVAALTVTAEREARMDFSHPYYTSGLGIAVSAEHRTSGWVTVLRRLFSLAFLQGVLALAAVLIAVGVIVWLLERRRNSEQFGGGVAHGLWSGFWWSAVTMTTVGYGDKAPATVGGRLVALVWMFASIITISGFTAAIASSLTVGELSGEIRGPEDLPGRRVGAVVNSTGADYLHAARVSAVGFNTPAEGLAALRDGSVDAFVYDQPIIRYLARTDAELRQRIVVLPNTFERQDYAIALPLDSPLRKQINQVLLERITGEGWKDTLFEYLGE